MDAQSIMPRVRALLDEAALALAHWLEGVLPRVTKNWREECVRSNLGETASRSAARLSELDFGALLRIADSSWYEMQTVACLPVEMREDIRDMMSVRNRWAQRGDELPGKSAMLSDLRTLARFLGAFGGEQAARNEVERLISRVEQAGDLPSAAPSAESGEGPREGEIRVNSLVYLTGAPQTRGVVISMRPLGAVTQYEVFVNNSLQRFFSGQIALVSEPERTNRAGIDEVRCRLTAQQINDPSSQNLYSLNSARIDFVPYQFRPALKLIHADEPRILIADSVGVGKTIEAGLIIKELEARMDLERIAVICPRPLVAERKWELEMKRFDEEFMPLDGPALRQIISDTDRDGEWPARYSRVIIPYSILDSRAYEGVNSGRLRCVGLDRLDPPPRFDLVIVDEAHHIRNGSMDREKAFAYKCTKYFCDHAAAVVMLTATPLQTGDHDLFTLLNVLRPDIVIDPQTFATMSQPNAYVSRAARAVRAAGEDWRSEARRELLELRATQWGARVIAENPLYGDVLARLEREELSREERVALIADIESLHSFGTLLNRTRRRDIQDFCVRRSHTVSTHFTREQRALHDELLDFEREALSMLHDARSVPFMMSTIRRQAASCIFGLAPRIRDIIARRIDQLSDDPELDPAAFDVDGRQFAGLARRLLSMADALPGEDPKFDATLQIIRGKQELPNNKIMLFSTFRHTLAYLDRRLSALGYRVRRIDGSTRDEERYSLKSRFELPREDPDALDLLLFTEVGSEGLDYQFCDTMINYDLPWNPMRIEQRIGRIDRRGQRSEAVNIYNIITEETVDAEIYYRCLARIGVFESSVGDCEEILGEIASGIEAIALDTKLTEAERRSKLEQMADNEVRKLRELERLEEEEKELFGFDLTELSTSRKIRRAENPWLTPRRLQSLVEAYIARRAGPGSYILGEAAMKHLRLSTAARAALLEDLRRLPSRRRSALRRDWEVYLSGNRPTHKLTFDPDAAAKDRDSFFITAMHPLARQAAQCFSGEETLYLRLRHCAPDIPAGTYAFSIYAWKYAGFNVSTKLVTICEFEALERALPGILEEAVDAPGSGRDDCDWTALEEEHVRRWLVEREKHRAAVRTTLNFRLESLASTHRNRVNLLENQIRDALNENIRRMRQGELDSVREDYARKAAAIRGAADRAELYATLLVNGVIAITEG